MRLTKHTSVLLFVATLLPLAYLCFFVFSIFFFVISGPNSDPLGDRIWVLFLIHIACMFWVWGLLAFYLVHLFKTDVVAKEQKALWAVVLFLGNMLAMPVYWYLYIWRPWVPQAKTNQLLGHPSLDPAASC